MPEDYLSEKFLVPLLQKLVRHPSEQTDLQEADPEVKAFIRDCLAPEIKRLEIGAFRYDDMGNLILEIGPANTGRSILFMTYAMTHPASEMHDPFSAELIDTSAGVAVRGRGVAEQKTAMTAAVAAIAQAAHTDLGGRLIFAAVSAGETGRHDAVASVLRATPVRQIMRLFVSERMEKLPPAIKVVSTLMSPSAGNPFTPACRGTASTQSTVRGGVS